MAQLNTLYLGALVSGLSLAIGCTGQLGSGGGEDAGQTGGPGGPGAPGAPGQPGVPGGPGDDPGAVPVTKPASFSPAVMRRLNRTEYNNTVRDLLGTDLRPGDDFPVDDLGSNFATVGSALSLAPTDVLAYEAAAHALIEDLFSSEARRTEHVPCDVEAEGDTCASQVLGDFATRAWRRPVSPEEVGTLLYPLRVAETQGATATEGLRHAMSAVLMSPYFIFKVELSEGQLDAYELATRLSYALWSTMPDALLFEAAASGALVTEAGLSAQVDRLLADDRAQALLENFAGHWLDYYDLGGHEVDATLFPEFNPELAESMKREVDSFILDALQSDAPATEMLTSSRTFVDERLAAHYQIAEPRPAGIPAPDLWPVDAGAAGRGGLLSMGALMTHTSFTSRTSPVKRGDFVLKHLMCIDIPPPPPDVPAGLPENEGNENETLRERMERHSQDPSCAGCHQAMDPIGFGLENFDAIGRFRTVDNFGEVNASGTMPDGETFEGAQELAVILAGMDRFPFCVTKHFMTYSIGRILNEPTDEQWAQYLTQEANAEGGSLKSLLKKVILSEPFRQRMVGGI